MYKRQILCSHLGKPKGEPKPELSLAPVAKRLSELLGKDVVFAADDNVVGENAKAAVAAMKDGDVVLLQKTRYRVEENKNGEAFSRELASLADVFVNDAFGTAHRAHCSTCLLYTSRFAAAKKTAPGLVLVNSRYRTISNPAVKPRKNNVSKKPAPKRCWLFDC